MADETFNSILSGIYAETCDKVKVGIRLHRESCVQLRYNGPFFGAQLDLTTVANKEYITFSVSYIAVGESTTTRVGLATRAFPGSHTTADIEPWIEKAHLSINNVDAAGKDLGLKASLREKSAKGSNGTPRLEVPGTKNFDVQRTPSSSGVTGTRSSFATGDGQNAPRGTGESHGEDGSSINSADEGIGSGAYRGLHAASIVEMSPTSFLTSVERGSGMRRPCRQMVTLASEHVFENTDDDKQVNEEREKEETGAASLSFLYSDTAATTSTRSVTADETSAWPSPEQAVLPRGLGGDGSAMISPMRDNDKESTFATNEGQRGARQGTAESFNGQGEQGARGQEKHTRVVAAGERQHRDGPGGDGAIREGVATASSRLLNTLCSAKTTAVSGIGAQSAAGILPASLVSQVQVSISEKGQGKMTKHTAQDRACSSERVPTATCDDSEQFVLNHAADGGETDNVCDAVRKSQEEAVAEIEAAAARSLVATPARGFPLKSLEGRTGRDGGSGNAVGATLATSMSSHSSVTKWCAPHELKGLDNDTEIHSPAPGRSCGAKTGSACRSPPFAFSGAAGAGAEDGCASLLVASSGHVVARATSAKRGGEGAALNQFRFLGDARSSTSDGCITGSSTDETNLPSNRISPTMASAPGHVISKFAKLLEVRQHDGLAKPLVREGGGQPNTLSGIESASTDLPPSTSGVVEGKHVVELSSRAVVTCGAPPRLDGENREVWGSNGATLKARSEETRSMKDRNSEGLGDRGVSKEDSDRDSSEDEDFNYSVKTDHYGFFVTSERRTLDVPQEVAGMRRLRDCARVDKWLKMIDTFDEWQRGRKYKKLRSRVRKGVPDCVRGKVWQLMAGSVFWDAEGATAVEDTIIKILHEKGRTTGGK